MFMVIIYRQLILIYVSFWNERMTRIETKTEELKVTMCLYLIVFNSHVQSLYFIVFSTVIFHLVKWKGTHHLQPVAQTTSAYSSFCNIKWLSLLLIPLDGILIHHCLPPNRFSWHFQGTHLNFEAERHTIRVKCHAQEQNTMTQPQPKPTLLYPKSSPLTIRPMYLPSFTLWVSSNSTFSIQYQSNIVQKSSEITTYHQPVYIIHSSDCDLMCEVALSYEFLSSHCNVLLTITNFCEDVFTTHSFKVQ